MADSSPQPTPTPAPLPIPDGYVQFDSRSEDLIAIVTCMTVLSTFVLILRLWTRLRIQGMRPGADDWTILASWVFSIAFTVNVCVRK